MTPIPVAIVILSFIAARPSCRCSVGSLRLPPHRVGADRLRNPGADPLLRPWPRRGVASIDLLFLAYNLWTRRRLDASTTASADGIEFGGSLAVESFGGYLIARAYVRDLATFAASLGFLVLAVASRQALATSGNAVGQILVHDLALRAHRLLPSDRRRDAAGLTRAYATFDHPILYGTFCSQPCSRCCG